MGGDGGAYNKRTKVLVLCWGDSVNNLLFWLTLMLMLSVCACVCAIVIFDE